MAIIRKNNQKNFIIIATIFAPFLIVLSAFDHDIRRGSIIAYSPINFIDSTVEYFADFYPSLKNKRNLKPIADIIPDAKLDRHKMKNLKVVFIIGESARSQNFSINGYEKNTTPQLQNKANLLSFSSVTPCARLTSYSVSCLLSRKTSKEFSLVENDEESVIKIFEKLGFTTAWFSTQKAVGDDNALLLIAMQAQKHFFGNSISKKIGSNKIYDEYLLDFLDKEVAGDKDNFVILHTQGSHFLFDDRYPETFKKFTPTCHKTNPRDCSRVELTNAYDNSILYTDHFITAVIDHLKDKNAILFYVSDHGQFLGEGGVYYHGSEASINQPEHNVPMFLWMSDSVIKNKFYRKKFKNAQLKTDDNLSHDNVFDSLLNCSGVDSKLFERNLSFCGK